MSYGATRSTTTTLAVDEQRAGVGGEQRQQLGVGAVGGGDDGVQQLVVLRGLEHRAGGGADRADQVGGVGVEGER